MFIEVGENTYELHAKLGISIMIEKKFKQPLVKIFDNLGEAEIPEMITILGIAAKKLGKNDEFKDFENDLLENWDYTDLQLAVSELIINLMFSGAPEQIEKKLEKFPGDEQQKNAFREAGLATLFWTKLLRTRNYFNYSSYPADFRVFNPLYSTGVR